MDLDALALFAELADRTASEREEYYTEHEVPATVRAQVESLVQGEDRAIDSVAGHVASAAVRAMLATPPQDPNAAGASNLQVVAIGRYEVVRLLGRGGMSEVYLVRDPVLDRDIAIKLIADELDDDNARRRVVREARAAGRLKHPNIVTIFDAGEHGGRPFIAMEYVRGETLRSIIHRQAPFPLDRRLELIEGACAGLAHAHGLGVVHLDIKPDNLMLDEDGIVKVLDFGIARVLNEQAHSTRHIAGTLRYMSPEQVAGYQLDRRSDVFSLGTSLFELVAYMPAYTGSTKEIVTRIAGGPVPRLRDAIPAIDPRLDAILARAMTLDPSDRFHDMDEMRLALARLRAEIDPVAERRFAQRAPHVFANAAAGPAAAAAAEPGESSQGRRSRPLWLSPLTTSAIAALVVTASAGMFWIWGARAVSDAPRAATGPTDTATAVEPVRPSELPGSQATGAREEPFRPLAGAERKGELDLPRRINEGQALPQAVTVEPRTSPDPAIVEATPNPPAPSPVIELPRPVPVPVPPPAVEAATAEQPASVDPKTTQPPSDVDEVLLTLRRWESAFEARDVSAVLQVFPSLNRDQSEEIRKTFSGMKEYDVEIRNPRVEVQADLAIVHAVVARRMTRVEGRTVANQVETEFRLRRVQSGWLITETIPRGRVEEADHVKK